jgi:hypothetical protein
MPGDARQADTERAHAFAAEIVKKLEPFILAVVKPPGIRAARMTSPLNRHQKNEPWLRR